MMRTQIGSSLVLEVKNFDIDLPRGWGGWGGLSIRGADTPLHSMPVAMAVTSKLINPCPNFKF